MKLWLLEQIDPARLTDFNRGFVVRAESEEDARLLASAQAYDEGSETWLNLEWSTCVELSADGPPKVILQEGINS